MMKIPNPIPSELILIVDPRAGLRVQEDKIFSIEEGVEVAPLRDLLSAEQAVIRPLYGVSEERLKKRTADTTTLMGVEQPLDLSIFYKITAPDDRLKSLTAELRELSIVQSAYIKPGPDLPSANTGDFVKDQGYLEAAAGGVDARYAWTKAGGRGQGVRVIDIEGGWRFTHEDLVANPCGCVGGTPTTDPKWTSHGTAVLGMLAADHNGFGVAGMCPDATVKTISIFGQSSGQPLPNWSYAAAIQRAADVLVQDEPQTLGRRGIILIELHNPGPALGFAARDDQSGYIPVEWWPCNQAAIQYATSRGIIVVEAGGNGEQDLDGDIYDTNPGSPFGPFPNWWRNPFRRRPIDTKAILVGAGAPPDGASGADRSRLALSNFGNVIDTQGWGAKVATCGGNNFRPSNTELDRQYTKRFSGTSSAAAMIAGVLACLQGILKINEIPLKPASARELLRDGRWGSPQQPEPFRPVSQRIGPRPDLRKLIEHLMPDS